MPITRRRLVALVLVIGASIAAAVAAALVSLGGDTERIDGYWVSARLTDDGLVVTEVIDYDFGPNLRRGIYRTVPGVVPGSVAVSSPTAPDGFVATEGFVDTEIRIGDPAVTIRGRHRYRIDYTLDRATLVQSDLLSWDAVGLDWTVPITDVEVFLAVPGGLAGPDCRRGTPWDSAGCAVDDRGDGLYAYTVDSLDIGEGVTVSGATAPSTAMAGAGPIAPSGPATDPGAGVLAPALITLIGALLAGIVATFVVRRAGRERVWSGGAADAAFGEAVDGLASRRLDEKQLAALATIEFEPPRDTSAVEGGLLLQERVRDEHRAAWLLESAIRGEIVIDDTDETTLRWGPNPAHPSVHQILDAMFDGRRTITLDEYDKDFAAGWSRLGTELTDWLHAAPHWDASGRRRRTIARVVSIAVIAVGALVGALSAVAAARDGGPALIGVGVGAVVVGLGIGTLMSSYELLVRTEAGSAMWLRIESFRRFLENSEARHVDDAAERGVLRHYTAWAVALGESAAWTDAVDAAARANPELRSGLATDLAFVHVGSSIMRASSTASTAPSSSSGGGFSGGVGGGGGGGGGGSW
ncbi:MAG: DUF2207 domain-containing protein [Actinomycetota bacterium]